MKTDIEQILHDIPLEMAKAKAAGVTHLTKQFKYAWPKISEAKRIGYSHKQIYEAIAQGFDFGKAFSYKYYEALYFRARTQLEGADKKTVLLVPESTVAEKPKPIKPTPQPSAPVHITPEPEENPMEVNKVQNQIKRAESVASIDWAQVRRDKERLRKEQERKELNKP